MPSFRRRASVIDADRAEEPQAGTDRTVDPDDALALAEEAEAEAAEAEAMAAAARARARAIRLRREAQVAGSATGVEATTAGSVTDATSAVDVDDATDAAESVDTACSVDTVGAVDCVEEANTVDSADEADGAAITDDGEQTRSTPARSRWRRVPRPNWKTLAATVMILCTLGLLGVSGYMVWHHREADKQRQLNAEYSAAGRQGVVTLMSLDFNNAQEDIQRIIDNSTGQFKSDFEAQAKDFVQVAKDSKVITEVTVNSTGVQSMDDDSAVVLVAASSRVTNTAGAKQQPRAWRLSVNLQREGDQIKMSKVEFVP
ncbi:hypothetical protein ASG82_00610 [Mycobacterium sp. Soil538]|nr:hypothetical protein ASG82_00610 [Mycobacterium sp. Soil538]